MHLCYILCTVLAVCVKPCARTYLQSLLLICFDNKRSYRVKRYIERNHTLRMKFVMSCCVVTRHFTSLHFTSLHFTSLHFTSLHFTPRHATPRHATPRHATPRHATPRHATPRHATPRHATPRHATPRHATPRHATPRHATPRHATPRHVKSRNVIPYHNNYYVSQYGIVHQPDNPTFLATSCRLVWYLF